MLFRLLSTAALAVLLAGGPAGAQTGPLTPAQVEAEIQVEALEWFQPDMAPHEFVAVELQSRCALGMKSPRCVVSPTHPIPPEVAQRVLLLLREGKEMRYQYGPQAFDAWLIMRNIEAERAHERAYAKTPVTSR